MNMYIPSVTEIIGFVNSRAFDHVPIFRLEAASARGTDVHSTAAAHLLGLWYEVTPEFEGYHQSLTTWTTEYVVEVVMVEQALVDLKRGFQGHPDALLRIRGDDGLTLVDWKTPKPLSLSWRLQLAGYRLLAIANGYKVARVASLRLDAGGGPAKFQGYTKTLAHDQNVFLSALNVFRFFN
jgi:lipocalin